MAKAHLKLSDGTVALIDGTPEEIAKVMNLYSQNQSVAERDKSLRSNTSNEIDPSGKIKRKKGSPKKNGPIPRVRELMETNFFNQKRSLQEILQKIKEKGHTYNPSDIGVPLLRLVRKNEMKRIKEKGIWYYSNP